MTLREERTGADSRHLWAHVDDGWRVTSPALRASDIPSKLSVW